MMKYFWFLAVFAGLSFMVSCDDDDSVELVGNWTEKSDFEGVARANASSFVINDIAYVVGGYDGDDYLNDLWAYNPTTDQWLEKAEFPGNARSNGVAFAIDGKGYYGTGYDGTDKLNDFWCYNPSSNAWTQITNFPGTARYGAVAFTLGNIGYVGTGYDDKNMKDFWAYDPKTDTWEQNISVGGSKRTEAVAFVIGDYAYVGLGTNNAENQEDFWRGSVVNGELVWVKLTDLDDDDDYAITRSNSLAFTINGLGYIATGYRSGTSADVWVYDPATDIWTERTSLEASSRQDAVGFAIGDYGYITTGRTGSVYFDNILAFDPNATYDDED